MFKLKCVNNYTSKIKRYLSERKEIMVFSFRGIGTLVACFYFAAFSALTLLVNLINYWMNIYLSSIKWNKNQVTKDYCPLIYLPCENLREYILETCNECFLVGITDITYRPTEHLGVIPQATTLTTPPNVFSDSNKLTLFITKVFGYRPGNNSSAFNVSTHEGAGTFQALANKELTSPKANWASGL
ncbi:hypothetical protein H8356DRAFT_1417782 [Neocallimastix lanati (nom. inval.)]|nr:hypothetical protein H8356DRAFT_1417782 [Neocallimastix sp. JGI-2020a]